MTITAADATWVIADNVVTTNRLPVGGSVDALAPDGAGATVVAGSLKVGEDLVREGAFNYASMVWVNGTQVGGARHADGNTVDFGAVSLAGLNVRMQYRVMSGSPVLRNLVTLENPSAEAVTVPVDLASNFGSDDLTVVRASSSGDREFTTADRWVVTDDASLNTPTNLTVFAGPGSPEVDAVSQTVFDASGTDTEGVRSRHHVTIPAGATRSLMFFHQMSDNAADSAAAAAGFNVNPPPDSELLAGLAPADLFRIANWYFNSPPVADAGGPYEVSEGADVTLDAGRTTDPDLAAGDVLAYAWDLDGDKAFDDAAGPTPTFSAAEIDGSGGTRAVAVRVTDAAGEASVATSVVNITNADPTAVNDAAGTSEDAPVTFGAIGNDTDPAGAADPLSVVSVTQGAHGAVNWRADGTLTYTPTPNFNGTDAFTYTIDDGDGGTATATVSVTVTPVNDAPVAHAGADLTGDEGGTVAFAGAASDVDGDPLDYAWDFGDGHTGVGPAPTHAYADDGAYTATLTVSDGQGGSHSDTVAVSVANVAPAVSAGGDATLDEGGTFTGSGSFADPGADAWTASVDYGDGTGPQPLALNGDKTFTLNHAYRDSGTYPVTVTVADGDGGFTSDTLRATVNNVAPTASVSNDGPALEGGTVTVSVANPSDPSPADAAAGFRYSYDFDGDGTFNVVDSPSASAGHAYGAAGTFNARVRIADKDGGFTDYTTVVSVTKSPDTAAAPVVGVITAPADPTQVGAVVNAAANFTDANVLDTHTAVWDWGDGTTSAGAVTEAGGAGAARGAHAYAEAGVYTVTLTVTDTGGAATRQTFNYVVVYDPTVGFVTGGGWINSPAGAYAADPTAAGKATFGFVARHHKGATAPTGNTEFQFKAGNLNFKSTSYDWLVVSGGGKAKFKGAGTVNGRAGYGFMLTVIDGGPSGPDKFRIKIWDNSTGAVVYDNQMGAHEDADADTALGGGSIVIHTK